MQRLHLLIGLLFLLGLMGLFDLAKMVSKLMTERKITLQLQQEIALLPQKKMIHPKISQAKLINTQSEVIEKMIHLLQVNQLKLSTVNIGLPNQNMFTLNLVLFGAYQQLLNFFADVERIGIPFLVTKLIILAQAKQVKIILTFNVWQMYLESWRQIKKMPMPRVDPFVPPAEWPIARGALTLFSLREMHWVGYLQQGHAKLAIIKLPNAESLAVTLGERIGKENGKIINITSDKVEIQTAQQKIFLTSPP